MLTELLERIFSRHKKDNSRVSAKRRLQIVLAHDRTELSPAVVEKMRQEILEVVSRYVEIDLAESEFSLESDQRTAALIANLPIRKIKDKKDAAIDADPSAPEPPEEVLDLSMDSTELPTEELEVATSNTIPLDPSSSSAQPTSSSAQPDLLDSPTTTNSTSERE